MGSIRHGCQKSVVWGTSSELRNTRFDGRADTNARNLGTESDERIQCHITTMSTLGGMINAVIEWVLQSIVMEIDPEVYTPTGDKDAARSPK